MKIRMVDRPLEGTFFRLLLRSYFRFLCLFCSLSIYSIAYIALFIIVPLLTL